MDRKAMLRLAMLCHDLGKPVCTIQDDRGRTISPGHDVAGVEIAKAFLDRLGAPKYVTAWVLPLVRHHMFRARVGQVSDKALRRLARDLAPATLEDLADVMEADIRGRGVIDTEALTGIQGMRDRARELALADAAPKPLVLGRHLLELGMKPGPKLGEALRELFEAQLDGEFECIDDGIAWFKRQLA